MNLHHRQVSIAPGQSWTFTVSGLHRKAKHCTDGAKSAYVTLADGRMCRLPCPISCSRAATSEPPPVLLPEGKLDLPFALQPWPAEIDAMPGDGFPVVLYPAAGSSADDLQGHRCGDLAVAPPVRKRSRAVQPAPSPQGRALSFKADPSIAAEGYKLTFSTDEITLLTPTPPAASMA
jgi:hexosaminidase